MAFRRPLYYSGGNLREMNDTMIQQIRDQMFWSYINNPSVTLFVFSSGGNLGTIYDSRLQAGAASTGISAFPDEATTAEPSIVYTGFSRLNQGVAYSSQPADTSSRRFPVYYTTAGDIRSMTLQDMYDTFGSSTISALTTGGQIYTISGTSGGIGGYSIQSYLPVFTDTRANTGAYTASGISETQDQPFDVAYWYFYKRDGGGAAYTPPAFATGTNNIQSYSTGNFNSILEEIIRHMATDVVGNRIRYSFNGSGNNCGSGMTDTRLNGSGAYTTSTVYASGDDYRAQEFPDGTAFVADTFYLREARV